MLDVLIAMSPLAGMSIYVFGWYALKQMAICVAVCVTGEALFTWMRKRRLPIDDCAAAVTGMILALSLPWSTPWYVAVIGALTAIGLGKFIFGGLGRNIFNPAMVGRAFVMICFPAALGASAYVAPEGFTQIVTQATPLTAAKNLSQSVALWPLFIGNVNGSLGETSALACIIGGVYLCLRRTASWEIPAGTILATAAIAALANTLNPDAELTLLHHLLGGALLFGAFFIATDPASSPLTRRGKFIFGLGVGVFVMIIRLFSGYPEGVMFSVLLMNSMAPLINRWTIPRPVGGRPAAAK